MAVRRSPNAWNWPAADGAAGETLITDGAGNLSLGAPSGSGTAWETLYDIDFSALSSVALTHGANTIDSKAWRVNISGTSTAAITNGTGMVLTAQNNANGVEASMKLAEISTWDPSRKTRLWLRLGFPTAFTADFHSWWLALGWDIGSGGTASAILYGRQYRAAQSGDRWRFFDGTNFFDLLADASYDVSTLVFDGSHMSFQHYVGVWSSGFPDVRAMQMHTVGRGMVLPTPATTRNPASRAIGFNAGGAGGTFPVHIKRMLVEQR